MTTGFFGGTFDPIHLGHIRLAKKMLSQVDTVLFCPAAISPCKMDHPPVASGKDRLAMIRLAIADEPRFRVSDIELNRPPPSYTIDTIKSLIEETGETFRLILGGEVAKEVHLWKEAKALLALAPVITAERTEINATKLREDLKKGIDIKDRLDPKVLDYILTHHLY